MNHRIARQVDQYDPLFSSAKPLELKELEECVSDHIRGEGRREELAAVPEPLRRAVVAEIEKDRIE